MRKKNVFVPVLILAALVIWGNNIYQLFLKPVQDNDEMILPQSGKRTEIKTEDSIEGVQIPYTGKYRDPFSPPYVESTQITTKKTEIKKEVAPPVVKPIPPTLRLCGILSDSSGLLALIETASRESFFVHPGDSVQSVAILGIENDHVVCQFKGENYPLWLKR